MFELQQIGIIKSDFKEPADPTEMRKHENSIIIEPEFAEGLYKIEGNDYLQVIFYLHRSKGYNLKGPRRYGKVRGVFASRSPKRPSPIGITTLELLERKGKKLKVKGLDAVDGTPVIDLKPYAAIIEFSASQGIRPSSFRSKRLSNIKHILKPPGPLG